MHVDLANRFWRNTINPADMTSHMLHPVLLISPKGCNVAARYVAVYAVAHQGRNNVPSVARAWGLHHCRSDMVLSDSSSVYFLPLSSRSQQVCLASSDLLNTHLPLAGMHFDYYYYHCRSHEWGVMSFHWYFTSALPRSLLGTLPLIPAGLVLERRVRPYVLIITAYVLLYSLLPHKEVSACLVVSTNSW